MPMTSNEEIFDRYIRHQTYLIRYAGGLRNETTALLEATENKIADTILAYAARLEGATLTTPKAQELIRAMEKAVKEARAEAWDEIDAIVTTELKQLSVDEAVFGAGVIEGAVPVALGLNMPPVSQLQAIAISQPFEGRVLKDWLSRTEDFDVERITRAAKVGIAQGETPTQVTRRVMGSPSLKRKDGVVRKAFHDLESVILTATNGIQNEAKAQLYAENADILDKEQYAATLDARTTLECAVNDGKLFKLGEGPKPPLHFRCRSLRIPYINPDNLGNRGFDPTTEKMLVKEFAEQNKLGKINSRADLPYGTKTKFDAYARKRRRELIGQVPAKTTYSEWLGKQSKEFQNEVLGPTRAEMFRNGEIKLDKFVARDGDTLTLDELRRKGIEVPNNG